MILVLCYISKFSFNIPFLFLFNNDLFWRFCFFIFLFNIYLLLVLLFLYILFKIGICQCIGKSLCKMCWASCETYCFALEDITCFLWHKLLNTKRINRRRRRRHRRRFRDIEQGYSSGDESDITRDNYHHHQHRFAGVNRTNSSAKRRRRDQKSAATRQVSVYVRGGPRRLRQSARSLQLRKVRNVGIEAKISKRRRLK